MGDPEGQAEVESPLVGSFFAFFNSKKFFFLKKSALSETKNKLNPQLHELWEVS